MSSPVPTIDGVQRYEIAQQIGRMNILSISGGRVAPLPDGLELPVSNGYRVRVHLTGADDYTVERVFIRSGKVTQHGERTRIYADQVGETAYRAGMFRSYSDEEW
jgi:hypothetical protein